MCFIKWIKSCFRLQDSKPVSGNTPSEYDPEMDIDTQRYDRRTILPPPYDESLHPAGQHVKGKFNPFCRECDKEYVVSEADMKYLQQEPVPLNITIPDVKVTSMSDQEYTKFLDGLKSSRKN